MMLLKRVVLKQNLFKMPLLSRGIANMKAIRRLRELTGGKLADCKEALEKTKDNVEEAVKILLAKVCKNPLDKLS